MADDLRLGAYVRGLRSRDTITACSSPWSSRALDTSRLRLSMAQLSTTGTKHHLNCNHRLGICGQRSCIRGALCCCKSPRPGRRRASPTDGRAGAHPLDSATQASAPNSSSNTLRWRERIDQEVRSCRQPGVEHGQQIYVPPAFGSDDLALFACLPACLPAYLSVCFLAFLLAILTLAFISDIVLPRHGD